MKKICIFLVILASGIELSVSKNLGNKCFISPFEISDTNNLDITGTYELSLVQDNTEFRFLITFGSDYTVTINMFTDASDSDIGTITFCVTEKGSYSILGKKLLCKWDKNTVTANVDTKQSNYNYNEYPELKKEFDNLVDYLKNVFDGSFLINNEVEIVNISNKEIELSNSQRSYKLRKIYTVKGDEIQLFVPLKTGKEFYYFITKDTYIQNEKVSYEEIWKFIVEEETSNDYTIVANLLNYSFKMENGGLTESVINIIYKSLERNPHRYKMASNGIVTDLLNSDEVEQIGNKKGITAQIAEYANHPELLEDINIQMEVSEMRKKAITKETRLCYANTNIYPLGSFGLLCNKPISNGMKDSFLTMDGFEKNADYTKEVNQDGVMVVTVRTYLTIDDIKKQALKFLEKEAPDKVDTFKKDPDAAITEKGLDQYVQETTTNYTLDKFMLPTIIESTSLENKTLSKTRAVLVRKDVLINAGINIE